MGVGGRKWIWSLIECCYTTTHTHTHRVKHHEHFNSLGKSNDIRGKITTTARVGFENAIFQSPQLTSIGDSHEHKVCDDDDDDIDGDENARRRRLRRRRRRRWQDRSGGGKLFAHALSAPPHHNDDDKGYFLCFWLEKKSHSSSSSSDAIRTHVKMVCASVHVLWLTAVATTTIAVRVAPKNWRYSWADESRANSMAILKNQ